MALAGFHFRFNGLTKIKRPHLNGPMPILRNTHTHTNILSLTNYLCCYLFEHQIAQEAEETRQEEVKMTRNNLRMLNHIYMIRDNANLSRKQIENLMKFAMDNC